MASRGIPEPLKQFLREHIPSVEQLEVLVLLRATEEREWSVSAVCDELKSSLRSIEARLTDLQVRGLLAATDYGAGPVYRYAPATDETRRLIDDVARAYKERRIAVINLIYEEPESSAVSFSEAFKITKRG